jgi:N-acetylglucosamine kinase-like BadF-type ATPase
LHIDAVSSQHDLMKPDSDELVLGVDGGGSKTVAWLAPRTADDGAEPLGTGRTGPGNPRSVGFAAAQQNIAAAVADAFAAAGLPSSRVAAVCLGLAGAGRASEQEMMRDWVRQAGLARQVFVTHDARITLAAGRAQHGIALICGTGSLAWGQNPLGMSARAGGWGYLLGDEGSGYAVALAGLRAAARAADGRGPETALLAALLDRLAADEPARLIERVYEPSMTRARIAGLAAAVFELAGTDPVATEIVRTAASDLAELVVTLAARLQLPAGAYDLILAGGILVHHPSLRDTLLERLHSAGWPPGRQCLVTEPVRGAVALARMAADAEC